MLLLLKIKKRGMFCLYLATENYLYEKYAVNMRRVYLILTVI